MESASLDIAVALVHAMANQVQGVTEAYLSIVQLSKKGLSTAGAGLRAIE